MFDSLRSSRRAFLRGAGFLIAGLGLKAEGASSEQATALDPSTLTPFVDALPIPELASPAGTRVNPENSKESIPLYRIAARESRVRVHRDLPPTRMWTFGGSFPGPTIETQSGQAVMVDWENQLPTQHFLPGVDRAGEDADLLLSFGATCGAAFLS
jgi:spore coat protein A, manganese oxidase